MNFSKIILQQPYKREKVTLLLSSIVLKDSEYVVGLDDIKLLEGIFLEQPKAPALENDPVSNVEHQHYYCVQT